MSARPDHLASFTAIRPVVLVTAQLVGFRPGPQIGTDYGSVIELALCQHLPEAKP